MIDLPSTFVPEFKRENPKVPYVYSGGGGGGGGVDFPTFVPSSKMTKSRSPISSGEELLTYFPTLMLSTDRAMPI